MANSSLGMKKRGPAAKSPPPPPRQAVSGAILWERMTLASGWLALFVGMLVPFSLLVLFLIGNPSPYGLHLAALLSVGGLLLLYSLGARVSIPSGMPSFWGWAAIGAFLACSYRVIIWSVVHTSGEYRCLLSNNLGDSCLHLALVNSLGLSSVFDLKTPWLGSMGLSYPLGPDAIDGAFVAAGLPAPECMRLTGLILCTLTAVMLWLWGRAFGVVFFLFSGSILYLTVVSGIGVGGYDPHWKNLFLTVFAPQRGMQVALPLGILVLLCCRSAASGIGSKPMLVAAAALSVMPFSSVHSCLALLPIFALTVALSPSRTSLLALVLAGAGILLSASLIGVWEKASHVRLEFFLGEDRIGSAWLWIVNFGILVPLLLLGAFQAVRYALRIRLSQEGDSILSKWEASVMCFLVFVFFACLFVAISPWAWDNTKIMLWVVVASAPTIWKYVLSPLPVPWRSLILAILIGVTSPLLLAELGVKNRGHGLFSSEEYNEGISAKTLLPEIDLLAASPDYNHPWLAAGHYFLAGYEGWLWSHGSKYTGSSSALRKILKAEGDWEQIARSAGVTHILWGDREQRFTGRKTHPAEINWRLVRSGKSGKLYSRD
jgi:hypothetical protein